MHTVVLLDVWQIPLSCNPRWLSILRTWQKASGSIGCGVRPLTYATMLLHLTIATTFATFNPTNPQTPKPRASTLNPRPSLDERDSERRQNPLLDLRITHNTCLEADCAGALKAIYLICTRSYKHNKSPDTLNVEYASQYFRSLMEGYLIPGVRGVFIISMKD